MASIIKVACVVVMCMAVMSAPIALAITCGQVTGAMAPCITYLTKGGSVTERCCNGVKGLLAAAQTTADKQAACNCLKSAAASLKVNDAFAQALPGKCGVSSLPYKISTSTNCATIKF